METRNLLLGWTFWIALGPAPARGEPTAAWPPCRLQVVEQSSGWPVPLVQLRTTSNLNFVSDNAGWIEIRAPELMNREVYFAVEGHGYEVDADGFGYRGVRLTPKPGSVLQLEVRRTSIARRLGRLTGIGRFISNQAPPEAATAVRQIVGCDSVQSAVHNGRRFWVWGDTTLLHYPLGIFHASAAVTAPRPLQGAAPPLQIAYDYFTDHRGNPRAVARMVGAGPTWLSGLVSLPDQQGRQRLVATFAKVSPPLDVYQWGLCVWDENELQFRPLHVLWTRTEVTPEAPSVPTGHAVLWRDQNEQAWVGFGNPFLELRCPATFEAWQDPDQWESLQPPTKLSAIQHDQPVTPHSGSMAWHPVRERWVTVFTQAFGQPSAFGEVWYAESREPTGPWGPAVKVLSHRNHTFYNPRVHVDLTSKDEPLVLFEGTFSAQFTDHAEPVPRYDYNQILYRIDYNDPRLPPAVSSASPHDRATRRGKREGF